MKARAKRFLSRWCSKHIKGIAFPQDRKDGIPLAAEFLADAKRAGISARDINATADGDLVGYMFDALYHAAETELKRLVVRSRLDRLITEDSNLSSRLSAG